MQTQRRPGPVLVALALAASVAPWASVAHAQGFDATTLRYLREHDDTLPNGDDIREKLAPYLSSVDLLDGFSYTHKGGKLADVGDPAETEIGSLDGPGGRVRIYADGHVTLDQ